MKMNKLFYALGIGCALCACSSNDDSLTQKVTDDEQADIKSNKYVAISIVTATGSGTRADEYTDGDPKEYGVKDVAFFFYDRLGNCVDTEYKVKTEDANNKVNFTNTNVPAGVTVMATMEVELAANRVYDNVIVVLNPKSALFDANNKLLKKSKEDILDYYNSYSVSTAAEGAFTMSNSVFVDDEDYNGNGGASYVAVPITAHNIYTKEKKDSELTPAELEQALKDRAAKAINVYVERVCSKVIVENAPSFDVQHYYVDEAGTTKEIPVMVTNTNKDKSEEVKIKVEVDFKGMGLSVTAKNAYLLKSLSGLDYSFDGAATRFVWNDAKNHRSYWETTLGNNASENGGGYNYAAWNNITTTENLVRYINPNTIDATSREDIESDNSTKLLVCAQLMYTNSAGERKGLDLVKFSDGYWMADYLVFHAATRAYENLQNLTYTGIDATDLATAKAEVAKIKEADIEKEIQLVKKNTGMAEAYLAKLELNKTQGKDPDFMPTMAAGDLKTKVSKLVLEEVKSTLSDITDRQIQYWKNGMTYFYVPIRHEGFNGLGGNDNNYLNGVVRNHVYKITIGKVWGLGTPVIDENEGIDPERPKDAPDSYMTAKIHVLKWRVVESNVTMH